MTTKQAQTQWAQFMPLVTVFFFWGFVAASNDILIPVFKQAFHLTQTQSQLVSLAFYVAYTVGSILYLIVSAIIKDDLINRIGYKNGLALGLGISALGTLLFYPAANTGSFDGCRGAGEIFFDKSGREADGIEDLRAAIGLIGRDAHLGHHL